MIRKKASAQKYDAIVIGAGPNGLAASIALAKEGLKVLLVEAHDTVGGGCRSAELTLPNFVHDVCSSVYPSGYGSPFFRTLPLEQFGLKWINPEASYAHPFDNERAVVVYKSIEETAAQLGEDAEAYSKLMNSLQVNWDYLCEILLHPLALNNLNKIIKHIFPLSNFSFKALGSAEHLAKSFRGDLARGLFAGVCAHSTLPLNSLGSASIGLVLNMAAHIVGWPIPEGGAQKISDALAAYFVDIGGEIITGEYVHSIHELPASDAILFDLMPKEIIKIAREFLPGYYKEALARYQYGAGCFKMDWALDGPIPWNNPNTQAAPTVHLGCSFEEIAESEYAANHNVHPKKPFVLLAQNSLFDSSRAPGNMHTAWAYCHVPNGSSKDMANAIENQIERFAFGFKDKIIARHQMPALALQAYNPNYIGGDINGGSLRFGQLLTRPVVRDNPYTTPNEKLYICSSATPPGSGVHGMPGYYAALTVLKNRNKVFVQAKSH